MQYSPNFSVIKRNKHSFYLYFSLFVLLVKKQPADFFGGLFNFKRRLIRNDLKEKTVDISTAFI
jgi:hypothetical protein